MDHAEQIAFPPDPRSIEGKTQCIELLSIVAEARNFLRDKLLKDNPQTYASIINGATIPKKIDGAIVPLFHEWPQQASGKNPDHIPSQADTITILAIARLAADSSDKSAAAIIKDPIVRSQITTLTTSNPKFKSMLAGIDQHPIAHTFDRKRSALAGIITPYVD